MHNFCACTLPRAIQFCANDDTLDFSLQVWIALFVNVQHLLTLWPFFYSFCSTHICIIGCTRCRVILPSDTTCCLCSFQSISKHFWPGLLITLCPNFQSGKKKKPITFVLRNKREGKKKQNYMQTLWPTMCMTDPNTVWQHISQWVTWARAVTDLGMQHRWASEHLLHGVHNINMHYTQPPHATPPLLCSTIHPLSTWKWAFSNWMKQDYNE